MYRRLFCRVISLATIATAARDGSGSAYANSCQAALWSWSAESQAYGSTHPRTSTISSDLTASYPSTVLTGHISAKTFVTLCDGHPRVVGNATFQDKTTAVSTISERETATTPGTAFPTPAPCSINPSDCAVLWGSFYEEFEDKTYTGRNGASPAPPCATTGTANPLTANSCTAPYLLGTEARLLYWPVRTVSNEENEEIFCNKTALKYPVLGGGKLPATITGTPTASGPNTFVTGGITITSPTVGIYMAGLKRVDGCGPTLSSTIVLAPPGQVSSARGQDAAYNSLPFGFADLNWKCEEPNGNGTFTLQDGPGNNCYQDVPADAYFGGMDKWKGVYYRYSSLSTSLIIANDYRPAIYPPTTFLETASRIWGPDVEWLVEGIWDPPIALLQVSTEQLPTAPPGEAMPTAPRATPGGVLTTPHAHGTTSMPSASTTEPPIKKPGAEEDKDTSVVISSTYSPTPALVTDIDNTVAPSSELPTTGLGASKASEESEHASEIPTADTLGTPGPTTPMATRVSSNEEPSQSTSANLGAYIYSQAQSSSAEQGARGSRSWYGFGILIGTAAADLLF